MPLPCIPLSSSLFSWNWQTILFSHSFASFSGLLCLPAIWIPTFQWIVPSTDLHYLQIIHFLLTLARDGHRLGTIQTIDITPLENNKPATNTHCSSTYESQLPSPPSSFLSINPLLIIHVNPTSTQTTKKRFSHHLARLPCTVSLLQFKSCLLIQ